MLTYAKETGASHVEFVSYDGKAPNYCSGKLVLLIDGVAHSFIPRHKMSKPEDETHHDAFWNRPCLSEDGEWDVMCMSLPETLLPYAFEIDRVFNDNVDNCCCGGCE